MSPSVLSLLQGATLCYALLGGVFLAFSDFIMRSLARTAGAGGVDAMQSINREVYRWLFMGLFLGMAAMSVWMIGYAMVRLDGSVSWLVMSSGLIYVLGCFGVTVRFNVPMNEALAQMDLAAEQTRAYWTGTYLPRWTFWNTVRAAACIVSAAILLFGLPAGGTTTG